MVNLWIFNCIVHFMFFFVLRYNFCCNQQQNSGHMQKLLSNCKWNPKIYCNRLGWVKMLNCFEMNEQINDSLWACLLDCLLFNLIYLFNNQILSTSVHQLISFRFSFLIFIIFFCPIVNRIEWYWSLLLLLSISIFIDLFRGIFFFFFTKLKSIFTSNDCVNDRIFIKWSSFTRPKKSILHSIWYRKNKNQNRRNRNPPFSTFSAFQLYSISKCFDQKNYKRAIFWKWFNSRINAHNAKLSN